MAVTKERQESFVNVRVRIQRLSDAKFYSGWCRQFTDTDVILDITGGEQFEMGSTFFVTINGVETAASFPAEVVIQQPGYLKLRVLNEVRYGKIMEEARRAVMGLSGVIHLEDIEVDIQINDVSAKGFGGTIEGVLPKGTIVRFSLECQFGTIGGSAEVRYCRPETKEALRHRVGLKIEQMGRIESARWMRLSDD